MKLVTSKTSKTKYAMKVMKKKKMTEYELKSLNTEIEILKNTDHPNVLKIYGYG